MLERCWIIREGGASEEVGGKARYVGLLSVVVTSMGGYK